MEKMEPSYTFGRDVNCAGTMENSVEVPHKTKNGVTI